MAAYNASIKKALDPQQKDLIKHKEHCSADPEKLATAGRALWHQVRIKRNDDEYGLYTVSEVRQENPDNIVRMGKGGRERLGTSDEFDGTLNSQVPDPTLSDADAERDGEFVERLDDDGAPTGLIAIAPHGGDIEPYTDQQAERVRSQLAGKGVSSWRCKGWHPKGPLTTGTSPRPISTRRAFLFSTRSSLEGSVMPLPFMDSTTTTFGTAFSSAASHARP